MPNVYGVRPVYEHAPKWHSAQEVLKHFLMYAGFFHMYHKRSYNSLITPQQLNTLT